MDLTGAPYRTIRFDDADLKPKIASGELWRQLHHYDVENYIMSASTPGEDVYTETGARPGKNGNGLVAGHAYTLISVKNTSKGDKLVKLRNPWGSMEWNGDWSDTSDKWTPEMQAEVEQLVQSDDGTFWMSFEDLVKHFYSINVCMVRHTGLNQKPWREARRKFHFDYDSSEATPDSHSLTCPTYILHVTRPGAFVVSVHQEDIRCATAKPYMDVGVSVLKANPVYGTFTLMNGTGNSVERQNQTDEFQLAVGKYVVVPTSTGAKLKQYFDKNIRRAEGSASPVKVALVAKNDKGEVVFTKDVYRAYEELFVRFDLDGDGFLSKLELDQYMIRTEGSAIEEKAYMWLLHNFESREKRGLTLAGFIRAQLFVFKHTGANEERLRNEFKLLGYDDSLHFEAGRSAALVIHSTGDFSLESAPFDHGAFKEAMELPCVNQGECISFEDGQIHMYKYRSGYHGLSFVVENRHPTAPLVFVLDCAESVNVISHRDSLSHQETIPPNQRRVMHHLMPADNDTTGWSWAYSASYMWEDDE
jgi:Ca2+-binding EF-hand superfamily protein